MKYTFLQYEFRGKWIHTSWCDKLFASDDEHFDRVRDAIFGLKDGSRELVYPEAAARMKQREQARSRQIISLYASLGAFDNLI